MVLSGRRCGTTLKVKQSKNAGSTDVRHKGMVLVVTDSLTTNHRSHHFLYKLPRPYLSIPGILIWLLTLEYEFGILFRNVGKNLPIYTASNPKRAQISLTPRPKPKITHSIAYTICIFCWPTESDWPTAYFEPMYSFFWLVFYYKVSEKSSI